MITSVPVPVTVPVVAVASTMFEPLPGVVMSEVVQRQEVEAKGKEVIVAVPAANVTAPLMVNPFCRIVLEQVVVAPQFSMIGFPPVVRFETLV